MRLKLVPNLNFDQHLEASALRDNLGEVVALGHPWVLPCHGQGMSAVGLGWEMAWTALDLGALHRSCPQLMGVVGPADPLLISGADHLQNPTESLPLAMAKEAKVSELEDDQLAEEDLPVLDNQ